MADTRQTMLSRKYVFGARSEVKDCIHFIDENTCCWVAGRNLVVYNMQMGTQKFIPSTDTCESITAMAISPNRRSLAVAESGDTPCIAVYDPISRRRKRVLSVPDVGSREYMCLAFSADGRYLVSQGGFPEWNVVYWNIEKTKALAMIAVADKGSITQDRRFITQCSISPKDSQLICVSGNTAFKFFRYSDGQLRQAPGGMGKGDALNYLAHVWLPPDDRMIVSTDNGDLLLVENCEYKFPLPLSPSDGLSIDSLVAHSKGFICGGDMGLVTIFERSEDKELYKKMRTMKVEVDRKDEGLAGEDSVKVLSFSLTPPQTEECLAVATSNKQLYLLNLSNVDFSKADDHVFDPIAQPFHAGPITGLDVCIRKPLIVTCGKDRNIILWNYNTNTVEIVKHNATEILSVAMHPSGQHLLVGFADKLRFMNIYVDDIREFKTFGIRSCSECRFSNGGQFFAAMHSTIIHVYNTYTCDIIGHLRGHNGKIRCIYFVPPDDNRIVSVGVDGAVFEFSMASLLKVNDHIIKAISYTAVTADPSTVWAVGNDRKLRQIERAHLTPQEEFDLKNCAAGCLVQSLLLKLLFVGCDDGTVRVYNTYAAEKAIADRQQHPDKERTSDKPKLDILVESHSAHSSAVTRIAMTHDEGLVASVGDDGVLTLWDIVAPQRGMRKEAEFAEEILIDKSDLENRTRSIQDLMNKVQDLKQKMEHQQYKRELKHEERIQELKDRNQAEKEKQTQRLESLLSLKEEQAMTFREMRADMDEKHKQDIAKIDQEYTAKIQALEEQAAKLKLAIEEQRAEFKQQLEQREVRAQDTLSVQQSDHEARLQNERTTCERLKKDKECMEEDAEEVCQQIELDTDMEIMELKERYELKMKEEQEQSSKLQGENVLAKKKERHLKTELDGKKAEISEKQKQQAALHAQINGINKDIDALKHEMNERSETIGDKDKRIYDLKKKNQELEKFKFVLEYKIRELKSQIEPREEEIRLASEKYKEMEAEADRYLHNNESLVLNIRGLKLKLDGQKKEIENLKGKLSSADEYQQRLHTELTDLYEEKNPRKLKEMTKALYYRYTTAAKGGKTQSDRTTEDAQREYNRERDYLEKTVAGLKTKLVKDSETHSTDRSRIMNENVTLIKEINELRREVRTLKQAKLAITGEGQDDSGRELDIQRAEMLRLRAKVDELERMLHASGKTVSTAGMPPVA